MTGPCVMPCLPEFPAQYQVLPKSELQDHINVADRKQLGIHRSFLCRIDRRRERGGGNIYNWAFLLSYLQCYSSLLEKISMLYIPTGIYQFHPQQRILPGQEGLREAPHCLGLYEFLQLQELRQQHSGPRPVDLCHHKLQKIISTS